MKRIIGTMTYNTEAPGTVCIASTSNDPENNLRWTTETIYRTARGSWFIVGRGGTLTCYNADKSQIFALTEADAKLWLYLYDHAAWSRHFGESKP